MSDELQNAPASWNMKTPRRSILIEKDCDGNPCFLYESILGKKFTVICTKEIKSDGKEWLHVSVAGKTYMPSYEVIKEVKDLFIGEDLYAIAVMPPKSEHVNFHQYCWHWWHCLDGHPLPEMSGPREDLGLEKSI